MTWATAYVAVTFLLIGAAWGSSRGHRDAVKWIEHFVSADAGQRSAIRDLYLAEGYEAPNFYADPEPEPRPSWWMRAWARLRGRQETFPICPDCGCEYQSSAHWEKCLRHAVEVGDAVEQPDPSPATQPIVMPEPTGPTTQPDMKAAAQVAPLTAHEEWEREFRARAERDIAEIRGTK